MKAKEGLIALAVVLGILLIGSIIWGFRTNSQKNDLTLQNEELTTEMEELTELRESLAREIDSLEQEYSILAEENEALSGSLTEVEGKLASTQSALSSAKRKSANEINGLRAEIEQLIAAKAQLESRINNIQMENDSLKMVAGILTEDLNLAREENQALSNLNETMNQEVKKLTLANFKASAFRVDTEQKNDKVSSKARRVREIKVSFDLTNVPEEFQGLRPLYLTISDDKGVPIQSENPINTKVVVNGQAMDLIAQKSKDVDIAENQRLNFSYELEDKLESGAYRVAVYTDIGMLGASSFILR